MFNRQRTMQSMACFTGFHVRPPQREPEGPIVSHCPSCGMAIISYRHSLDTTFGYQNLLVTAFPKVLGPIASV